MSEETGISSGMETAEISVDSNHSDKTMHHHTCSPLLNFSISRLLSGGGGGGGGGDRKNNNNHLSSSKHSQPHHHKHTIHYHGTQRDPEEDEERIGSRRGSRVESRSPTTTAEHHHMMESDSDVDVRNSEDSEVEMDDVDDSCSNNNNSSVGNNNNRSGSSGSKSVDHDNDYRHGSPDSKTGDDADCGNSNRSTPDSQIAHGGMLEQHPHLQSQLASHHQHLAALHAASGVENLSSNGNNHDSPTGSGQNVLGGGVNPFPVFGYSSIFLPNFPCPITSPNQVIRVPAHRPMSNFQLFGQSALGQHAGLDLNATPLFSNFDPRNSLLLKDRLHGKHTGFSVNFVS